MNNILEIAKELREGIDHNGSWCDDLDELRSILTALVEADAVMKIYGSRGSFSTPTGMSTGTFGPAWDDWGKTAREWLKKWGTE